MNLDDCWGEKNRTADGVLQASMFGSRLYVTRLTGARRGEVPERVQQLDRPAT